MPDVRLLHTSDGGEVEFINGVIQMDGGLYAAVYLSLFGGNQRDSGNQGDDRKQWWANLSEPVAARRYRSETQHLLRGLPAIPANLARVNDASGRDLAWFTETKLASLVSTRATMPARNTVRLEVNIVIDGKTSMFDFVRPWGVRS